MADLKKLDAYELVKELIYVTRLMASAEMFERATVDRDGSTDAAREARSRTNGFVVEQIDIAHEIQHRINGR